LLLLSRPRGTLLPTSRLAALPFGECGVSLHRPLREATVLRLEATAADLLVVLLVPRMITRLQVETVEVMEAAPALLRVLVLRLAQVLLLALVLLLAPVLRLAPVLPPDMVLALLQVVLRLVQVLLPVLALLPARALFPPKAQVLVMATEVVTPQLLQPLL